MTRRTTARAWLRALLIGGLVLLGVRLVGGHFAEAHVQRMSGRDDVGSVYCGNCHLQGGSLLPQEGRPHPDPFFLAAGQDADVVFVSQGPLERVARLWLDGGSDPLVSEELRGRPRGLALSPDGLDLAVALAGTDEVAFLDPVTLVRRTSVPVGTEPSGLAFASSRLFVANAGSGDVSVVEVASGREVRRIRAGREPFAIAATPAGDLVAVVSRMAEIGPPDVVPSSEITLIDPATGRVERRILLPSCHMSEAAAFTPDGRHLLVPTVRVRNLLPITQVARGWVMSGVLAVVEVATGRIALLPLGDSGRAFADPSGIAIDNEWRRVWVGAGGQDEVVWLDLEQVIARAEAADAAFPENPSTSRDYVRGRIPVGRNPHGLLWTPAGLAVAERLDDTVGLYSENGPVRRLAVGPPVPEDEVRRGDAVFHDATYAFQQGFSCRSCHPGGHTDGLTYDFDIDGIGRDIVLNRSLLGVAGTEPFKWIGLNPTLARQCGARFAMVLTRADPFPDAELDDLVAYLESLPPPRPAAEAGRIGNRDSGAVARGKVLFERSTRKDGATIPTGQRCNFCHSGPHYTNRLRADVGTRGPLDSTGDFDVPHLTGLASKAPFLHDGRALSLEEIWTAPGVGDQHGVMTDLNKADLNDLVQYLRTL